MATSVADRAPEAEHHVAGLSRSESLLLLEAMVRSREARRNAASRRSARVPGLDAASADGWEALEAAATRAIREGDLLFAAPAWPLALAGEERVGPSWRLVDVPNAACGAALTAAPGSIALAICEAPSLREAVPALQTCVRRSLPLVVLAAERANVGDAAAAAASAEARGVTVAARNLDEVVRATDEACARARAGDGPTVVACVPDGCEDPVPALAERLA